MGLNVADRPQIASATYVLIEEAAADVEILVVAGWQCGLLVLGKPLRERDHFAGRRRSPGGWPLLGLGAVVLSALTDHLVRSVLSFAPAPGFGSCLFRGGRCMTASVALTARRRPSAPCADRCWLAQVDAAAIVLPEHRDQTVCLAGDLVDDGAEVRLTDHDVVEPHFPDCGGAGIDQCGRGGLSRGRATGQRAARPGLRPPHRSTGGRARPSPHALASARRGAAARPIGGSGRGRVPRAGGARDGGVSRARA